MRLGGVDPLIRMIDSFRPDIMGMSLRNIDNTDQTEQRSFVAEYRSVANTIRTHTQAPLVLGGSGFTLFPEEMMAALGAEYGIVGEGERLTDLLGAMENNEPINGIPGVVTQTGPKTIPPPLAGPWGRKQLPDSPHLQYYLKNGGGGGGGGGGDAEPSDQARVSLQVHLLHLSPYRGKKTAIAPP